MDETLDPRSSGSAAHRHGVPALVAVMQVLFHADLRRLGDEYPFGPAHEDGAPVAVGRDVPDLFTPDGHPSGALRDPCISRRQLTIRYLASPPRFEVTGSPDARRPVRFFTISGAPLDASASCIPAGSLIAIGDRILLWVGVLPPSSVHANIDIVGTSTETRKTRREILALAPESETVLIRGETGTGKELVARALHAASTRAGAPFVAVNCAAIPESLMDSELFGYEKGAFSGAAAARDGLFRAAGHGTIFLDEIGELSSTAQPKLLRALQERRIRPVGSTREHELTARVVAATHRPLEDDVAAGRFRADLLARIESPRIDLPSLRDRRVDIPILFTHFLVRAATASGTLASFFRAPSADAPVLPMAFVLSLMGRPWTRNVRELEKHATVAELSFRTSGHWPAPPVHEAALSTEAAGVASAPRVARRDRARPNPDELARLLDEHDFVQRRVADELGISRTTLDKWMREHGIRRPSDIDADEIVLAQRSCEGDLVRMAASLRISVRGLKLRMRELRLAAP